MSGFIPASGSNRTYKRDKGGKFASGSGVRDSLAGANSIDDLNVAAAGEFKRVTGRDIKVDMRGSDLQIAKEQLEGISRGLDEFPGATLTGVYSYGKAGTQSGMAPEIARLHPNASAVTQAHGLMENHHLVVKNTIYFNVNATSPANAEVYRQGRKEAHAEGYLATDSPMGTALHEFGHVIVNQGQSKRDVYDTAVSAAEREGASPSHYISKHVSRYASSDMGEFAAEAFSDVMVNGSDASPASIAATDVLKAAYSKSTGGGG